MARRTVNKVGGHRPVRLEPPGRPQPQDDLQADRLPPRQEVAEQGSATLLALAGALSGSNDVQNEAWRGDRTACRSTHR